MPNARRVLALALLLPALACGGSDADDGADDGGEVGVEASGGAEQPPAAQVADGRPQGLFFMTRVWITTNSLEKAVWYFAPDGRVYENLAAGFSDADLAAHAGNKGTFAVDGDELAVTWSDGTTTTSTLQRSGESFSWNAGLFTPVRPFRDGASIAGTYGGGESFRTGTGNGASSNTTLELRADGTYAMRGSAALQSTTGETQLSAGSSGGGAAGRWRAEGYSLALTDAAGATTRAIAFPYDDDKTPVYPDRLFFGGTMYTRQ